MPSDRMDALEADLAALRAVVETSADTLRAVMDRVDAGDDRDAEIREVVTALDTAVHKSYAGRGGIGPELLANITADEHRDGRIDRLERNVDAAGADSRAPQAAAPDALTALWTGILGSIATPFKAFAAAKLTTQLIVLAAAFWFGLLLTDGGREIIAGFFAWLADRVTPDPAPDSAPPPSVAPADPNPTS